MGLALGFTLLTGADLYPTLPMSRPTPLQDGRATDGDNSTSDLVYIHGNKMKFGLRRDSHAASLPFTNTNFAIGRPNSPCFYSSRLKPVELRYSTRSYNLFPYKRARPVFRNDG